MNRKIAITERLVNAKVATVAGVLSGFCIYLSVSHAVRWLVWIALVPLFLARFKYRGFLPGFVSSATLSVFAFAWMIRGTHAFTGAPVVYGIVVFVFCAGVFSCVCGFLLWVTPPVMIVPVWVLAEMLLQWAAQRMPWFLFHIGNGLATDLYAIQPMSVIGVAGAGFVVVLVNYLAAWAVARRNWRYFFAAVALVGGYFIWGWWLLPVPDHGGSSFPLAIVRENIPPEVVWDSTNGNQRVHDLLGAEDRCIAAHPRMVLWAESAIPWTYSPDDDLVKAVVRHSGGPGSITHILGMNTAVSSGVVRNSAYCLLPDGRVSGRYDKIAPLLFIEQPWMGWQFPWISSDGYSVEPGDGDGCVSTPCGKAGVLICNESALPGAAASRVRAGAQFLLNLSNDGWFRDTWLVGQHFYNARLRAVETRRDVAICSNGGWSGCIHASGRVDTTGILFAIRPAAEMTVAVRWPLLPVYGCLLFGMIIFIINQKTRKL